MLEYQKLCVDCCVVKPLAEFYRTEKTSDGRQSICKACVRLERKRYRRANEKVRELDRIRAKDPKRKQANRETVKRWRASNPEAYKAETAVGNALRDGKIIKGPCVVCGVTKRVHAHHEDYSKPLEVTWLCATHHHRLHAERSA
jgi:hypothetical protein